MIDERIRFLIEADKLKQVLRQNYITGGPRRENSAEHSWHVVLAALILHEHSNDRIDVPRVIMMLIVHDIVEIDAGDSFVYDATAERTRAAREQAAAERIFGLLPPAQSSELRSLWNEFEAGESAEARFALAVDRFLPCLHNYCTGGLSWKNHGITAEMVLKKNDVIRHGSESLWSKLKTIIDQSVAEGILKGS